MKERFQESEVFKKERCQGREVLRKTGVKQERCQAREVLRKTGFKKERG